MRNTTFQRAHATTLTLLVIALVAVAVCLVTLPIGRAIRTFSTAQPHALPSPNRGGGGHDAANRITGRTPHQDVAPHTTKTTSTLESMCAPVSSLTAASDTSNQQATMAACFANPGMGWCVDRQGDGRCVAGQLAGPDKPSSRCAEWWFDGMCLVGARCSERDPIPPPSVQRGGYHHPAPYGYRTWPWVDGEWKGNLRAYPAPECGSGLLRATMAAPAPSSKASKAGGATQSDSRQQQRRPTPSTCSDHFSDTRTCISVLEGASSPSNQEGGTCDEGGGPDQLPLNRRVQMYSSL
jgi:hypothetical protein